MSRSTPGCFLVESCFPEPPQRLWGWGGAVPRVYWPWPWVWGGVNRGRKEPGVLFAPHPHTILNLGVRRFQSGATSLKPHESGWEVFIGVECSDRCAAAWKSPAYRCPPSQGWGVLRPHPGLPCFSALWICRVQSTLSSVRTWGKPDTACLSPVHGG